MESIKKDFKECDLYFLEKSFGLVQLEEMNLLDNWILSQINYSTDDFENRIINHLQKKLKYRVNDWNEYELIEHFIGPLFSVIDLNTYEYGMFSERLLKAVIGDYELSGYPDAVVAKGRRRPEIPYFCFHEYKKEKDPDEELFEIVKLLKHLKSIIEEYVKQE